MVRVKVYGTLRLDSGVKELCAEADSIRALYPLILAEILRRCPEARITERQLKACLVSVNGKPASPRTRLRDGDVVGFFPPAAGG